MRTILRLFMIGTFTLGVECRAAFCLPMMRRRGLQSEPDQGDPGRGDPVMTRISMLSRRSDGIQSQRSCNRRWLFSLGAFVLLMLLQTIPRAVAQEARASLGGRITDPKGAVIQKARVTVTSDATGVMYTTRTNGQGNWIVNDLLPGVYHFEVTAPGFASNVHNAIDLQANDQKTIDSAMSLESASATVTVESGTPLIDTTSAVSGTVLTSSEMEALPSLSNAPSMFIALTPGVTVTNGTSGSGIYLWSNLGLSEIAVNGTGTTGGTPALFGAINYIYDGGNDVNNSNELAFEPPIDAVGEYRVITNAFDASIGRNLGTTALMVSKTGGKKFHGDLYEYNQNDFLNANSYSNDANHAPLTPVHINFYGGAVGGPVWIPKLYDGRKKQTFFFFSYSRVNSKNPTNTGYITVPDAMERMGDFSQSFTVVNGVKYPINIFDPNTVMQTSPGVYTRSQFSNNMIPTSRLDPVAQTLLKVIGLPNSPATTTISNDANNYLLNVDQDSILDSEILRLDQSWNNANHTYLNIHRNYWNSTSTNEYGAQSLNGTNYAINVNPNQSRLNRGLTLDHTILIKPNLMLDLTASLMNYYSLNVSPTSGQDPTSIGFSSNYTGQMQIAAIPEFSSISNVSGNLGTTYGSQYQDDLNQDYHFGFIHEIGNHTLRYGGQLLLQQSATGSLLDTGGQFVFGTSWTTRTPVGTNPTGYGSSLAEFLLGLPSSGSIPTTATAFWSQHYYAAYLQDDWKVTDKLTLDLGLRWDIERPVTERFNRFASRFDPNFVVSGVTGPAQANYATDLAGSSSNSGTALLQAQRSNVGGFVARGGLLYAGLNGTSPYVENPRYKYFQPRVGFAYRVYPNIVLRGGVGRFVQADFATASQTGYSQTTNLTVTTNNFESAPNFSLENPYPSGLQPVIGNSQGELTNIGSVSSYTDPNIGRIYTDVVSLSLQHQIGQFLVDTSFILNETHGLPMSWEVNDPAATSWYAAYNPQFTSTGAPVLTLPGNTLIANPFYHVAGVQTTLSQYTSSTIGAYSLLRPNPILGNLTETRGTGLTRYTALQNKIERRFRNGFSLLSAFTWGKSITANTFYANQVAGARINHELDPADTKFHEVLTPVYDLPFGHGKRFASHVNRLTDEIIGGWQINGEYQFQSGTPVVLPTTTAFFEVVIRLRGVKAELSGLTRANSKPSQIAAQLWRSCKHIPRGRMWPHFQVIAGSPRLQLQAIQVLTMEYSTTLLPTPHITRARSVTFGTPTSPIST